jgi:hypothetical protein
LKTLNIFFCACGEDRCFFIFDTLNPNWKVVVQKELQACKVIYEVEDVVLRLQALDEKLVTQSSMREHVQ